MNPEDAHLAYRGLRDRVQDGLLAEEVCETLVHGLRWRDRDGVWWQIDPRTGSDLRWSGTVWERSRTVAKKAVEPAGRQGPAHLASADRVKKFFKRLAVLVGVAFFGYSLFPTVFSNSITVVVLLLATWLLMWGYRQVLAMGIQKLDALPMFDGVWRWHRRTKPWLRKLGGIAVPMGISFVLAQTLSTLLGGSGFLVLLTLVAINTVVAHFFFGPAPALPQGGTQ